MAVETGRSRGACRGSSGDQPAGEGQRPQRRSPISAPRCSEVASGSSCFRFSVKDFKFRTVSWRALNRITGAALRLL